MHLRTSALGVDEMALPNDLAAAMPPVYQHVPNQHRLPQQRPEVSEAEVASLGTWADHMDLPGMDT